jgi:hypothetical protein
VSKEEENFLKIVVVHSPEILLCFKLHGKVCRYLVIAVHCCLVCQSSFVAFLVVAQSLANMADAENAPPVKVVAPADSKAETSTDTKVRHACNPRRPPEPYVVEMDM